MWLDSVIAYQPLWMPWAGFSMLLEGAVVIAALIYYRNKPKPKWLALEIKFAKWLGQFLRIIKRLRAAL